MTPLFYLLQVVTLMCRRKKMSKSQPEKTIAKRVKLRKQEADDKNLTCQH